MHRNNESNVLSKYIKKLIHYWIYNQQNLYTITNMEIANSLHNGTILQCLQLPPTLHSTLLVQEGCGQISGQRGGTPEPGRDVRVVVGCNRQLTCDRFPYPRVKVNKLAACDSAGGSVHRVCVGWNVTGQLEKSHRLGAGWWACWTQAWIGWAFGLFHCMWDFGPGLLNGGHVETYHSGFPCLPVWGTEHS